MGENLKEISKEHCERMKNMLTEEIKKIIEPWVEKIFDKSITEALKNATQEQFDDLKLKFNKYFEVEYIFYYTLAQIKMQYRVKTIKKWMNSELYKLITSMGIELSNAELDEIFNKSIKAARWLCFTRRRRLRELIVTNLHVCLLSKLREPL